MSAGDFGLALLVQALWGCNFVAAKIGLNALPPLFLMGLRFAVVSVLLVPVLLRHPCPPLGQIVLLSVLLGGINFPLVFIGMTGIDAATAAIATQLQVPFASLLATLLYGERLGWDRAIGMMVAFSGVVIIAGEPRLAGGLGCLALVVVGSFAFSAVNIQIKRIGAVNSLALNAWLALFATPQLLGLSLLFEHNQLTAAAAAPPDAWAALAFMSVVVTIGAFSLWCPLVQRYPVNQTMPFLLTVPVFGVLSAALVLGDPVTPTLVVGGLLTLVGLAVIILRPRAPNL